MGIDEKIANFLCPEYGSYPIQHREIRAREGKKVIRKSSAATIRKIIEALSGFVAGKNC